MSGLKYAQDATWARLPFEDFRPRFFIETYIEKLRMYTPHFYQSRLMNIFSACSEMMTYIDAYQENERNGSYILSAMEEILECWDADPIIQEAFGEFSVLASDLSRKVKASELDLNVQARLKVLCRAVLSREDSYLSMLIEQLEMAITGLTDLNQRDRITSSIDRLTGLYTTFLLNQGYSPTYLYNRAEILSRDNNYSGRSFSEQFQMVTGRLRNQKSEFEVYYGFHASKPSALLSVHDEQNLQFLAEIPAEITGNNLEKFKKNIEINVIAKVSLTATDYVTAALRSKEKIDRFLDTITALEFGSKFQTSANCITIHRGNISHTRTLNIDVLLAFMSSDSTTTIFRNSVPIRQLFSNLNEPAKDQLGRSLRYLRLAKHSVSLEQKLLNLWIALESLFANTSASIIGNILEFVPQFYATTGIVRRVSYLRELLIANKIAITPIIATNICPGRITFDDSVSDNEIFLVLRNEQAAIELFSSLGNKEHLKFKLMKIFEELKNNKAITARIKRSEADVSRQLRRIYFLRNKIAHTGHFHGVRPQLTTHLLDYIAISYRVIATAASKAQEEQTYSIPELLAAARMGTDIVTARVASKDEVTALDHVTLNAVM